MRLSTPRLLRERFAANLILVILLGLLVSFVRGSPIAVRDGVEGVRSSLSTLNWHEGDLKTDRSSSLVEPSVISINHRREVAELFNSQNRNGSKVIITDPEDPPKESDAFQKAKCKGQTFMSAIAAGKNAASKYQSHEQLAEHKWIEYMTDGPDVDLDVSLHMEELGIDPNEESWYRWGIRRKNADGGGLFFEKFNPEHGLFVAVNNKSGQKDSELGRFSDVGWLGWKAACENEAVEPGDMRWLFQHTIVNDVSKGIVAEVFERNKKTPVDWPGLEFGMDTAEGQAMLGSPNGLGLGWMIKDHQHYFKRKTVGSVKVWYGLGGKSPYPNMLFTLVDMPAPPPEEAQPPPPQLFRARL